MAAVMTAGPWKGLRVVTSVTFSKTVSTAQPCSSNPVLCLQTLQEVMKKFEITDLNLFSLKQTPQYRTMHAFEEEVTKTEH